MTALTTVATHRRHVLHPGTVRRVSGRADLFRFAEAHARNTSETAVYHLGNM